MVAAHGQWIEIGTLVEDDYIDAALSQIKAGDQTHWSSTNDEYLACVFMHSSSLNVYELYMTRYMACTVLGLYSKLITCIASQDQNLFHSILPSVESEYRQPIFWLLFFAILEGGLWAKPQSNYAC
jgi:hypothetical protein